MQRNIRDAWKIALTVACLGGAACTAQEVEVRQPDGTRQTYRNIAFHPHFDMRPDQITVRDAGTTDDGFPVVQIQRKDGKGGLVFKVTPPGAEPLYFEATPVAKPAGTGTTPSTATDAPAKPVRRAVGIDAARVEADLSIDRACLLTRVAPEGPWTPVCQGSLARVASAAAELGVLPLE
ncbi:MAG: hypothetical protein EB145_07520, partial [Proteobacteria bacterium]|nr:hypothetical protein [Pseudomonadota bacterium]